MTVYPNSPKASGLLEENHPKCLLKSLPFSPPLAPHSNPLWVTLPFVHTRDPANNAEIPTIKTIIHNPQPLLLPLTFI